MRSLDKFSSPIHSQIQSLGPQLQPARCFQLVSMASRPFMSWSYLPTAQLVFEFSCPSKLVSKQNFGTQTALIFNPQLCAGEEMDLYLSKVICIKMDVTNSTRIRTLLIIFLCQAATIIPPSYMHGEIGPVYFQYLFLVLLSFSFYLYMQLSRKVYKIYNFHFMNAFNHARHY